MNGRLLLWGGLALAAGQILTVSCGGGGLKGLQDHYARLDELAPDRWAALAGRRIFFGHKSVGYNIVEGMAEVMAERPAIKLNVRETSRPEDLAGPVFAHAQVGSNKDPFSKIRGFEQAMGAGLGLSVDIAFFKFCFVDIDHTTDLDAVFRDYADSLARLRAAYPEVEFVTVTVPLISRPVGLKARLKKLLGRLPYDEADNIKRNVYNDMLRQRVQGPLFDLAAIESRIDGDRKATFEKDGVRYDLLRKAYTTDGGHLNAAGRQIVAIELLRFLATLED
jgi:hypothetical protein